MDHSSFLAVLAVLAALAPSEVPVPSLPWLPGPYDRAGLEKTTLKHQAKHDNLFYL